MATESVDEKKNRPYGYFNPDPKMIGYLFGHKGNALRELAKSIDDGVFIRFNDQTGNFDIWARSHEGVKRTRETMFDRQNKVEPREPQPHQQSSPQPHQQQRQQQWQQVGSKKNRQIVTVGNVTITIEGQTPVNVNLGTDGTGATRGSSRGISIGSGSRNIVRSGRPIRKIVGGDSELGDTEPSLTKATSKIPRPVIKTSGSRSWGDRQEEEISSSDEAEDDAEEAKETTTEKAVEM